MTANAALPADFDRAVATAVHQGECRVTGEAGVILSTVLGSCIAACIRDRVAGVGGMNHFLLAAQPGSSPERYGASARYGAFAMEQLINAVLSAGSGRKGNLEIKVFGGGKISPALDDVGAKNIEFVREFLSLEGYGLSGEDMGGTFARRVMFEPYSGRAFVKRLDSTARAEVARAELSLTGTARTARATQEIELW